MGNSECLEVEAIGRILKKLEAILRDAYYSTPPHIASKTLIYRALELTMGSRTYFEGSECR